MNYQINFIAEKLNEDEMEEIVEFLNQFGNEIKISEEENDEI